MRRSIVVFTAILLLVPAFAFAQGHMRSVNPHPPAMGTPPNDPFVNLSGSSVSGTVSAINGNLISIADGLIVIDATDAKIFSRRGASADILAVKPGNLLVAMLKTTDIAPNAPIPATWIMISAQADATLSGPVQTVDATTKSFQVAGRTIYVDADTEFTAPMRGNTNGGFSDVTKGAIVVAEVRVEPGRLVATDVHVMPGFMQPSMPFFSMYRGTVKTIGSTSLVIIDDTTHDDVTFKITPQTTIEFGIAANDRVIVMASQDGDSLTAQIVMRDWF